MYDVEGDETYRAMACQLSGRQAELVQAGCNLTGAPTAEELLAARWPPAGLFRVQLTARLWRAMARWDGRTDVVGACYDEMLAEAGLRPEEREQGRALLVSLNESFRTLPRLMTADRSSVSF